MNNAIKSFNKYLRFLVSDTIGIIQPKFGSINLITDPESQKITFPAVIVRKLNPKDTGIKDLDCYTLQIDTVYNNDDEDNAYNLSLVIFNHFNLGNSIGSTILEWDYTDPKDPYLTGNAIKITYNSSIKKIPELLTGLRRYSFEIDLEYCTPQ